MVGFEPGEKELSVWANGASGAGSGAITRALLQPLDVIKIRFQLQEEPLKVGHESKYHGILQATRSIIREEGITALWKGHIPAQYLSVSYGIVQFMSFELLTKRVWHMLPDKTANEMRFVLHFGCGVLAGCTATIVTYPFDFMRTRFVAQGCDKIYHNMWDLLRAERRCLYQGLKPTLLQIAPQTGLQFGLYSMFGSIWKFVHGKASHEKNGLLQTLVCGGLAGMCAKVLIYPLDLTKKRLQNQGFAYARIPFGRTSHYDGFIHCLRTIGKEEGFIGYYKGLSPSIVKAILSTALHFAFYEQLRYLFMYVDR